MCNFYYFTTVHESFRSKYQVIQFYFQLQLFQLAAGACYLLGNNSLLLEMYIKMPRPGACYILQFAQWGVLLDTYDMYIAEGGETRSVAQVKVIIIKENSVALLSIGFSYILFSKLNIYFQIVWNIWTWYFNYNIIIYQLTS